MKPFTQIENIRDIRKKLGLNQKDFWGAVGVTQSGGSRYESGSNMSVQVNELLRLVYIENVDLLKVNRNDLEVGRRLKQLNAGQYKEILQSINEQQILNNQQPLLGVVF